ncbi:MAG: hypothetical protein IRZ01_09810 [Thermoflavifilum aggregans]|nr:hypothetical protein [Thermoflavifilum aggregans]
MKKSFFLLAAGIVAGGLAGYLYYHFIGCHNGQCYITSHPLRSTGYGALMGGLFVQIFRKPTQNT